MVSSSFFRHLHCPLYTIAKAARLSYNNFHVYPPFPQIN
jgi:hypothetical protein